MSPAAIAPSRSTPSIDCLTNTDWSNSSLIFMPGGAAARIDERLLDRVDDFERRGVAVLDDAQQDRALAVRAHDVLLHQPAVVDLADVLHEHGGAVRPP